MSRYRILKELKKTLKRKKRRIALFLGAGAVLFLLATLAGSWFAYKVVSLQINEQQAVEAGIAASSLPEDNPVPKRKQTSRDLVLHTLSKWEGPVELVLHRTYLCGEETRRLGRQQSSVAIALIQSNRDWNAAFDSSGTLIMEQVIDDLSGQCRKSAYIAVDEKGNLSLYEGLPKHEKVIRTFFQLDVKRLETQLSPDRMLELSSGIRITDKEEYNSVLSTMNEFAKIMK